MINGSYDFVPEISIKRTTAMITQNNARIARFRALNAVQSLHTHTFTAGAAEISTTL